MNQSNTECLVCLGRLWEPGGIQPCRRCRTAPAPEVIDIGTAMQSYDPVEVEAALDEVESSESEAGYTMQDRAEEGITDEDLQILSVGNMSPEEQVSLVYRLYASKREQPAVAQELPDDGALIEAAEKYAEAYEGDDRDCIVTDVLNAYYAGAGFFRKSAALAWKADAQQAVAQKDAEIAELQTEILEQCRLNGMGAERESSLMAQLTTLREQAARDREDAERYRWLWEQDWFKQAFVSSVECRVDQTGNEAIVAAIAKEQK